MRLDKLLVALSVGSRTQVQRLVRSGGVIVSGVCVRDPSASVLEGTAVTVQGVALDTRLRRALLMHKPAGVLTAVEDKKQKTIMDMLPPIYKTLGCMPVGRLDKDATGLMILTTDGTLAHRLISPKFGVDKVYLAQVDSDLKQSDIAAFERGIHFKDFDALPARLQIVSPRLARITVHEGKFHQVKRMLHAVGHETLALHRVQFGPFALDEALAPGQAREMTREEMAALYRAADMSCE